MPVKQPSDHPVGMEYGVHTLSERPRWDGGGTQVVSNMLAQSREQKSSVCVWHVGGLFWCSEGRRRKRQTISLRGSHDRGGGILVCTTSLFLVEQWLINKVQDYRVEFDIKPLRERPHVPPSRPRGLILPPTGKLFFKDQIEVSPQDSLPVIIIFVFGQEVGSIVPIDLLQGEIGGIR